MQAFGGIEVTPGPADVYAAPQGTLVRERLRKNCGDSMSDPDLPSSEEYGAAENTDRGRLTIPKPLREDLQIEGGTRYTVIREERDIRLVHQLPDLQTVSSGRSRDEWEGDAFRDAGEATFGRR